MVAGDGAVGDDSVGGVDQLNPGSGRADPAIDCCEDGDLTMEAVGVQAGEAVDPAVVCSHDRAFPTDQTFHGDHLPPMIDPAESVEDVDELVEGPRLSGWAWHGSDGSALIRGEHPICAGRLARDLSFLGGSHDG